MVEHASPESLRSGRSRSFHNTPPSSDGTLSEATSMVELPGIVVVSSGAGAARRAIRERPPDPHQTRMDGMDPVVPLASLLGGQQPSSSNAVNGDLVWSAVTTWAQHNARSPGTCSEATMRTLFASFHAAMARGTADAMGRQREVERQANEADVFSAMVVEQLSAAVKTQSTAVAQLSQLPKIRASIAAMGDRIKGMQRHLATLQHVAVSKRERLPRSFSSMGPRRRPSDAESVSPRPSEGDGGSDVDSTELPEVPSRPRSPPAAGRGLEEGVSKTAPSNLLL